MKNKNDLSTNYSSKIKKIFIELHNYSYYHSPSGSSDVDERFIGRTAIKEKLKSLLTNSETKSGAYLVTGYRGMGKSSFVSKVLNEINSYETVSKKSTRYFRIFFLIILVSLLELLPGSNLEPNNLTFLILFPLGFFFMALGFLLKTDTNLNDLKDMKPIENSKLFKSKWIGLLFVGFVASAFMFFYLPQISEGYTFKVSTVLSVLFFITGVLYAVYQYFLAKQKLLKGDTFINLFIRTFHIEKEVVSKNRNRMITQDFYLASSIQIFASIMIIISEYTEADKVALSYRLSIYLLLFLILIIVNQILTLMNKPPEKKVEIKGVWAKIRMGISSHS